MRKNRGNDDRKTGRLSGNLTGNRKTESLSGNLSGPAEPDYVRGILALTMVESVGPARIRLLLEHFSDPATVFSSNLAELAVIPDIGAGLAKKITEFDRWRLVDSILVHAEKNHIVPLVAGDSRYPALLANIYDPPALLWVRGNVDALKKPMIAVVGTRNPSTAGRELTINLTRGLVRSAGVAIVSGLAGGVDTLAHRTTLEQDGTTVAVLGSGVDRIYPAKNIRLAHEIINSGGAVVSEYLPGTKPEPHHFPVRNRVVSGMSLGVVLTESAIDGGGVITVGSALEQNREVFVIPHDLRNPAGSGCNEIIQRGYGKPVIRISDILEELHLRLQITNPKAAFAEIIAHQEHGVVPGSMPPSRNPLDKHEAVAKKKTFVTGSGRPGSAVSAQSKPSVTAQPEPAVRAKPESSVTAQPEPLVSEKPVPASTKRLSVRVETSHLNTVKQNVCRFLTGTTWHPDDLSKKLSMTTSELLAVLLELELDGIVTQKPGKKFTIREW